MSTATKPSIDGPAIAPSWSQAREDLGPSRPSVLIVDDTPSRLVALEGMLRRDDIDIVTATSGRQALEILLVHEIALAIIDVQMPEMDGFELASLMHGVAKTSHVPVIFVTADLPDGERSSTDRQTDAVDYVLAPVEERVLRSKVEVLLKARHAGARSSRSEAPRDPSQQVEPAGAPSVPPTILLVEDEPTARLAFGHVLAREGYRVLVAAEPSEAFALAARHPGKIDLLLSDLRLPGMNGETLAKRLCEQNPGLRVIFMSGLPEPPAAAEVFLEKPVTGEHLVRVVGETLQVAGP